MHQPSPLETKTADMTRLRGSWLQLARVTWVASTLLILAIFISGIPNYLVEIQALCVGGPAGCPDSRQLTPATAQALQQLGISIHMYAVLSLGITMAVAGVYFAVALVIFWRRSDDWMALLVALMLVMLGAWTLLTVLTVLPSFWQVLSNGEGYLSFVLLSLVFCLFPDGRFRPRWTRWLAIGWVLTLFIGYFTNLPATFLAPFLLLTSAMLGGLLVAQVYRYRRLSGPVQRQQTKWVVLGVGVVLAFEIAIGVLELFFPPLSDPESLAMLLLVGYGTFLVPVLLPLSIGFAILRSRLWEVDTLINKALVYGTLTVLLVVVYAGLIIGLESLVGLFTSHTEQPVVIVISTLAIAALSQPLRHRMQRIIDRRFYRRKYDAARTLANFSATLRNEVDLDQLREELVAVVQETMQPSHVSLWLRPVQQDRKHQVTWSSPPPAP